jgi:hypothetical protein
LNGVTWHGDDVEDDDSDIDVEAAVVFPSRDNNVAALHNRNLHQHSRDEENESEIHPVKESEINCRPTARQRLPAVVASERINLPQRDLRRSSSIIKPKDEGNTKNTAILQQEVKESVDDNFETRPRSQALARMRSAPKSIRRLKKLLSQQRPWYAQQLVHFITLLLMMMLCVLR